MLVNSHTQTCPSRSFPPVQVPFLTSHPCFPDMFPPPSSRLTPCPSRLEPIVHLQILDRQNSSSPQLYRPPESRGRASRRSKAKRPPSRLNTTYQSTWASCCPRRRSFFSHWHRALQEAIPAAQSPEFSQGDQASSQDLSPSFLCVPYASGRSEQIAIFHRDRHS